MKKSIIYLIFSILFTQPMLAQFKVNGHIVDLNNRKPLAGIHIVMPDGKNGVVSDSTGLFSFQTKKKQSWFLLEAVGYQHQKINYKIKGQEINLGIIGLKPKIYTLNEINITSGLANNRNTPVNVTNLEARTIKNQLGDRPLPLAMQNIPGVYSVRDGGGSGDARLSIRGFKQDNVALLLNGVPINGVENGLVYWSNWLGLNDAAAEIQIQKGPGFTNLATNAVGGSINIVTRTAGRSKGGSFSFQITDYGNQKTTLSLNSGLLKNGWNFSFMGAYFSGKGYVDATYVKGFSYFFTANKQLNSKNHLNITLLGSPQHHGQRTLRLSYEEEKLRGNRFNKDWGSLDGQIKNASENFYHKPFLSINHDLAISKSKKLSNTYYISYGTGGGKWSDSFNYAPSIFTYRTESGQIDWNRIYLNNSESHSPYALANGDTVTNYAINIGTNFLASHIQTGFMSTFEQDYGKGLKLTAGLHYRYLNSFLREKITDLMGGKFYIEDYGWSLSGVAGRNQIKSVGDIIKVDNNSIIQLASAYARLTYETPKLKGYASIGGNNHWYQRIDRFNYIQNTKSRQIAKPGFDVRAGLSYSAGNRHIFYLNTAFISRAPYFKYVFGNFTNVPVQNLKNEQIEDFEIGYRYIGVKFNAKINVYYTRWDNVSMLSNEYIQLENNKQSRGMINGLNSLHKGVESEVEYRFNNSLKLKAFVSFGDYRWLNDVHATLINDNNVVTDTVNVFAKNLFVGGSAQNQLGASFDLRFFKAAHLMLEWRFYDKIFADFDPTQRSDPSNQKQAYRFPSYHVLNAYISLPFQLGKFPAMLQINAYNLLNNVHIESGEDGIKNNLATFRGYWSFGANYNINIKFFF